MRNFKVIFNQMKAHPVPVTFFIVAFIASSVLISIWTSNIMSIKSLALQKTEGIPENTLSLSVIYKESIDFKEFRDMFDIISNESNITFQKDYIKIDNNTKDDVAIILEYFKKTPIWRYPIIEGRDFVVNEVIDGEKKVLVGKKLLNKIYTEDKVDKIEIKGEEYIVVGVVGKEGKDSPWDNDIYIPMGAAPQSVQMNFSGQKPISFLLKNNIDNPLEDSEELENIVKIKGGIFKKSEIDVKSDIIANYFVENDSLTRLTTLIFVLALINMASTSIYWISERFEEIAIRKAFGVNNKRIIYMLANEIFSICGISFFIVLVLQAIINKFFSISNYSLNLTIQNILSGIAISSIATIITVMIPTYYVLRIRPIELLKN